MNTRLLTLPVVAALSFTAVYSTAAGAATVTPGTLRTPTPTPSSSPIGPGCKSLPQSGPGSPSEIANEPLATAASHIPDLSTFVDAAKKAGLLDTLNSARDITVFAPTNDAFNKVPKAQLNRLMGNKNELTKLLAYHVVQGRKTLSDLEKGNVTTLAGGRLSVHRSGDTIKVGNAQVVCGDLQTRNATVYIIDSVLKP
ncbi:MAG: beta-Ig-H3/fasciclin [Sphaerisporangium sp.]|jgi:uncharacterized surface protein with fasciclin (FAS1) repeats|nr:beta-Ig-H3/fasciclin [Sphaerisporangium sp.]